MSWLFGTRASTREQPESTVTVERTVQESRHRLPFKDSLSSQDSLDLMRLHVKLDRATRDNDLEKFTATLSQLRDVNYINTHRCTPLHTAASVGSIDMCRLLLEKGASINVKNSGGRTPIETAIAKAHDSVADFLIDYEIRRRATAPNV